MDNFTTLHKMRQNYRVHTLRHTDSHQLVVIHEMVHIAPKEFYDWKNEQFLQEYNNGFALHHEGVKAPELKDLGLAYQQIASMLNWATQEKPTVPFHNHDITWEEMNWAEKQVMKTLAKTLKFLSTTLTASKEKQPTDSVKKSLEDIKESIVEGDIKNSHAPSVFKSFLIGKRNKIAMKHVVASAVPVSLIWGKAHAPDFIQQLEKRGYKLLSTE